jgi:hypothetical protein
MMTHKPQPYSYRQLKSESEFRLLKVDEVLPRTKPQKWKHSIVHAHLETALPYETVSWVWGSGNRDRLLAIDDGTVVNINKNLEEAISTISCFCITGYLWIDQICIEQDATHEKIHQLKIMGRIYEKGEGVLVWLGISMSSLSVAFEKLCAFMARTRKETEPFRWTNIQALLKPPVLQQFQEYLSSNWFTRAWVYQEIVLSKKASFILSDFILPLPALVEIAQAIDWRTAKPPLTDWPIDHPLYKYSDSKTERLIRLYRDWKVWHGERLSEEELLHMPDTVEPFENFLSSVVPTAEVTNECDAIYAFLGLSRLAQDSQSHIPMKLNYQYSQRQVFTSISKAIIEVTMDLNIFEFLCRKEANQTIPDLFTRVPTWAPDWALPEVGARFTRLCREPLKPLKPIEPNQGLFDELKLIVRGAYKDTIMKCIGPISSSGKLCASFDFAKYVEARASCLKQPLGEGHTEVMKALVLGGQSILPLEIGMNLEVMVNHVSVLLMQCQLHDDTAESLRVEDRQQNMKITISKESIGNLLFGYVQRALQYIAGVCTDRSLYITKHGRLAVGIDLQPDDELCILDGCRRPVALRKNPCNREQYGVVETCYLQDYMDPWTEMNVTGDAKGGRTFVII